MRLSGGRPPAPREAAAVPTAASASESGLRRGAGGAGCAPPRRGAAPRQRRRRRREGFLAFVESNMADIDAALAAASDATRPLRAQRARGVGDARVARSASGGRALLGRTTRDSRSAATRSRCATLRAARSTRRALCASLGGERLFAEPAALPHERSAACSVSSETFFSFGDFGARRARRARVPPPRLVAHRLELRLSHLGARRARALVAPRAASSAACAARPPGQSPPSRLLRSAPFGSSTAPATAATRRSASSCAAASWRASERTPADAPRAPALRAGASPRRACGPPPPRRGRRGAPARLPQPYPAELPR